MTIEVRPATTDHDDLATIARIIGIARSDDPTTVDELRWADATYPAAISRMRSRLPTVAFSSKNAIVLSRTNGRSAAVASPICTPTERNEPSMTSLRIRYSLE